MRAAPTRPSVTAPIQPATVSARLLDDDVAAPFQILHAVVAGALGHLVPPAARRARLPRAGEDLAGLRIAEPDVRRRPAPGQRHRRQHHAPRHRRPAHAIPRPRRENVPNGEPWWDRTTDPPINSQGRDQLSPALP